MRQATDDEKKALKVKNDKIYPVTLEFPALDDEEIQFLIRAPSASEYALFRKGSIDEEQRHNALKRIVRPCILWPEEAEITTLASAMPGLFEGLGSHIIKLAGIVSGELGKAL